MRPLGLFTLLLLVVIAAFIIRAVLQARANRLRPIVQEPRPPQIIAAIRAAPLLEQNRADKAYVGMKVRWHLTFESVINSGLTITLLLQDPASLSPGIPFASVVCDVRRGKYPELNALVQHTPLWVTGQIKSIKGDMISLKNTSLEFTA